MLQDGAETGTQQGHNSVCVWRMQNGQKKVIERYCESEGNHWWRKGHSVSAHELVIMGRQNLHAGLACWFPLPLYAY